MVERYLEDNKEEFSENGYEVLKGIRLKRFIEIYNNQGTDINVVTIPKATTVLGIFDFRAFLNMGMLLVERNWLIGYRIAEEELKGKDRANYGAEIIKKLSKELTKKYGKGFDRSNLYYLLKFYKNFLGIVDAVSRQSGTLVDYGL